MTGDANSVDRFILGTLPLQSQNCATDYIVIPVPTEIINGVSVALPGDRFCGLGIGAVTSKSRHSVEHYLNQIELNFFIFFYLRQERSIQRACRNRWLRDR